MIFSELYSAYYSTVAAVIEEAVSHPVSDETIRKIIEKHAFEESVLSIPEAIRTERWQLIKKDGTTPIKRKPSMPLSILQKRWLKAIACDPRIRLFGDIGFDFPGIEPLFLPSDIIVFDKYSDGDDYEDEAYIANFRRILDAIKKKYPLRIKVLSQKGKPVEEVVFPRYLEYSEKDDKFRLITAAGRFGDTINLGRMISCTPYERPLEINPGRKKPSRPERVVFELKDERNALERVLLHFAHFEKTAERIDEKRYSVAIHYDKEDESEMVIRILSFGPMIRVTAPAHFISLIRQKLIEQKNS